MEKAYKEECRVTLLGFIIVLLLTHIFPLYFLFPGMTEVMIFGFPAHYLLTICIGWLVMIPFYYFYIRITDRIEADIEETSSRAAELGDASAQPAQNPGAAQ